MDDLDLDPPDIMDWWGCVGWQEQLRREYDESGSNLPFDQWCEERGE